MDDKTKKRIQEIQDRERVATPGPWECVAAADHVLRFTGKGVEVE